MIRARRGGGIALASHGGRNAIGAAVRHDFSVCLNAYGPSNDILAAIRNAPVDEYPDPHSIFAREAASNAWAVPIESLMLGAGSAELIDLVCRAFIDPGDLVAVDCPAFGEYERAARIYGAGVVREVNERARIVFVCSPSNPLGEVRRLDELHAIADDCEKRGALLVIDQAYDAFLEAPFGTPLFGAHPSVLHLRSMTKEHAIAGARVAFAVGDPATLEAMNAVRVPWSASSIAQRVAAAAFSAEAVAHVTETTTRLRAEATRMRTALSPVGYETNDSRTHFFTARVRNGADARGRLLDRFGVLVRDCTSFGLRDRIRVVARCETENDELLVAMTELAPDLLP